MRSSPSHALVHVSEEREEEGGERLRGNIRQSWDDYNLRLKRGKCRVEDRRDLIRRNRFGKSLRDTEELERAQVRKPSRRRRGDE